MEINFRFNPPYWFSVFFILLLVLFAYLPATLHLGFVWDDIEIFIINPSLHTPSMAWHAIWQPILPNSFYFRPLVMGSFAAQFYFFGVSSIETHLINLGILCANCILVWILAFKLLKNYPSRPRQLRSSLAALIYGLHPALVESTSWSSGRFDSMCTFFVLLGLILSLDRPRLIRFFLTGFCFFCGLLCKEEAIIFPVLMFLTRMAYDHQLRSSRSSMCEAFSYITIGDLLIFLFILILYFVLRQHFIHQNPTISIPILKGTFMHIAYVGDTLLAYFKDSFWPFGYFGTIHKNPLINFSLYEYTTGIATLIGAVVLLFFTISKRSVLLLLMSMWLVALIPVSNIIPLAIADNIIQDRLLTLPLVFVGLFLSFMHIPENLSIRPRYAYFIYPTVAVLWIVLSVFTVKSTVPLWRNNFTLWSWAYREYPKDGYVQANYLGSCLEFNQTKLLGQFFHNHPYNNYPRLKALHGGYLLENGDMKNGLSELLDVEAHISSPYRKLLAMHVNIANAHAVQGAYDAWFLEYLYAEIVKAYIAKDDYQSAYFYSTINTFYSFYSSLPWALRAQAAYGLDLLEDANMSFDLALKYAPPESRKSMIKFRKSYIGSLCKTMPSKLPDVCTHFNFQKQLTH